MEKGRSAYKLPPPRIMLYQSRIGRSGNIVPPPETRRLLSEINTIEFLKWEPVQSESIFNWKDVFDFEWTCFGCNVSTFKHAPFCHYSKSYSKRESDRFSSSKLNVNVQAFLMRDDLVLLCNDEKKFCKKVGVSCNTYHEQLSRHDVELASKEVVSSPSTNRAAQDLLLLKDTSMEAVDEEEHANANDMSLANPKNNEVDSDDNKPAAVEMDKQENRTMLSEQDTVENTSAAPAPVATTRRKRTSPNASKSKGVGKNKTTAKVRFARAAKASNVSNETKRLSRNLKTTGGSTTTSPLKGTPARGGKQTSQGATTRSLTCMDVNPSTETVVDVGILDKKKKATASKADSKRKIGPETPPCKFRHLPDLRQYANTDLQHNEKMAIFEWEQAFAKEPGVSSPMINALEMIIKFSNDIVKEKDIHVPARMTWMDGLEGGTSNNPEEVAKYGLKVLFVLMCSPRATDVMLKTLDDFLNGPDFLLDRVASMGVQEITDVIRQIGMQNQNALHIQQAFQKIKHGPWGGRIPNDYQMLRKFDGIGMKISLLVMQYVYGVVQVRSSISNCILFCLSV